MSAVRQRRNHAITSLVLVAAAVLIAVAAVKTLVILKGVPVSAQVVGGAGVSQFVKGKGADGVVRVMLLASAGWLTVFGLLLIGTRMRFLGLFWRLLALAGIAGPAFVAVRGWMFVHDPVSAVTKSDDPELKKAVLRTLNGGLTALGGGASPALGLYALTAGSAVALLALLTPSLRSQAPALSRAVPP